MRIPFFVAAALVASIPLFGAPAWASAGPDASSARRGQTVASAWADAAPTTPPPAADTGDGTQA